MVPPFVNFKSGTTDVLLAMATTSFVPTLTQPGALAHSSYFPGVTDPTWYLPSASVATPNCLRKLVGEKSFGRVPGSTDVTNSDEGRRPVYPNLREPRRPSRAAAGSSCTSCVPGDFAMLVCFTA